MMFSQLLIFFIGIFIIIATISVLNRQSHQAQLEANRLKVSKFLEGVHEKWRAWKLLGLDDALESELLQAKDDLGLASLSLQLASTPAQKTKFNIVVAPTDGASKRINDYYVIADIKEPELHFFNQFKDLIIALIFTGILFIGVIFYSSFYLQKNIGRPLDQLLRAFELVANGQALEVNHVKALGEIQRFKHEIERMYKQAVIHEQQSALAELATHVSHDIRSPLSALNIITSSLYEVPAEKRALMNQAIDRINAIASDLLKKSKQGGAYAGSNLKTPIKVKTAGNPSFCYVDALKEIVEEKKLAIQHLRISLTLDLDAPVNAMSTMERHDFSRVLSNLINNSIESIETEGEIRVALRSANSKIAVIVHDTGKGIPQDILSRLGKERISIGKEGTESGTGIGVLHARTTIEKAGGTISYQSRLGQGTIVTLVLPKTELEFHATNKIISSAEV